MATQSAPPPWLEKLATVTGSSSIEEAKIGGITPAVFSFSGRCVLSPPNIRAPT